MLLFRVLLDLLIAIFGSKEYEDHSPRFPTGEKEQANV
jgi:hypothetical protein